METAPAPNPSTDSPSRRHRRRTSPLLLLLIAVAIAAAIGWGMYLVQIRQPAQANRELNSGLVQTVVGLKDATPMVLDPKFVDSNGDLVAEGPADATHVIDPPRLGFTFVGTDNPEAYRDRFQDFVKYLSEKTGKPAEYVVVKNADEELRTLRDGVVQVAGVNTGNIPVAVNQLGFVPVCNLASEKGVSSYQMLIIVPANSPIQSVSDLKGHEIALTEPGSNSGFKAPLVLLRDNELLPGQDFSIRYSGSHDKSIAGIAAGTYQAAAVASDLLRRAEADGKIRKEQYRVIYTSPENFPTAGFGYLCTLKPDLAAKVKDAFLTFQWKGTRVEREFAASDQSKFAPVSYKEDFKLVRRIDDAIRRIQSAEPTTRDASDDAATEPATGPSTPAPTATAPATTTTAAR
jgi:phosphonate transport system substrate-binding protein